MKNKTLVLRVVVIALLLSAYLVGFYRSLSETSRRTLRLQDARTCDDCLLLKANIVSVNTKTAELVAHLEFRPQGKFAKDKVTPAKSLKLLINTARGDRELDFPKGERMDPVDAVFVLGGGTNEYPFDRHQASLWFFATTPKKSQKQIAAADAGGASAQNDVAPVHPQQLELDSKTLALNEPVPVAVSLSASVTGLRFEGQVTRTSGQDVTGILLNLTRSEEAMIISLLAMVLMMVLAISIFIMTLKATRPGGGLELVPLSLAMSLLFGLPALRNIQPDVPTIGMRGDLISFISAEVIVAVSIIVIAWTWILRPKAS
jgi:hypothetical protein